MTSQKDQIQALITDIDGVLQKTTPRLPWVVSGEMTQQRQVLERVRNYLVAFQRRQIAGEGFGQAGARPDLLAHDIYYQPAPSPYSSPQAESQPGQQAYGQEELNAQQMLQTIVQEMGYLRSNLMQPLQSDLEVLRQQRETLVHEIRQLEAQRQGYGGQLPGQQQLIAEFLQALMSRLQETLPQQVAQTLSSHPQALPYANNLALAGSAPSVIATSDAPSQGLGHIQVPQAPADELLIRLDSTLSIVFESLQRNVQAYQESLSQGLDKMHSMGQQGEMMFTALISHLAEQLGRETSSYLQPSATSREPMRSSLSPGMPTSKPLPTQPSVPIVNPSLFSQPGADAVPQPFTLPFPGTEIADHADDTSAASSTDVPVPSVDTAIDSWLRVSSASAPPDVDLEIAALNLDGFDLSQLADQDVNALLELDATLFSTNLPSQPLLSPTAPIAAPLATPDALALTATTMEDTTDIDAALKLLEQLSSELQEQPSSVADADAQIDRMLSSPTVLTEDVSTTGIPDDARDELDEFYESLFGTNATGTDATGTNATGTDAIGTNAIVASTQDAPIQVAPSATDIAPQPVSAPVVEPEAAVIPSAMQPFETQPVVAPSDIQPSRLQPNVQPISTLPAETQMPTGALVEPTVLAVPAASPVADPTLGWHLPTAPLVTQPAAEPEIPEALLEDELLDGWDFADAEMDLSEPATTPATDDLLGGWDLAPLDDRALLPVDAPSTLATDAFPATETLTAFGESQDSATDLATDASPELAPPLAAAPVTAQDEMGLDEINTLTDLFGDTAFDHTALAEEQRLGPAIADAPVPVVPDQPLVNPPSQPGWSLPDAIPTPTAPANLAEGYLADDRYTPASPDEDLLSLDEPIEPIDSELWLDESTLSRLSEDLFNLEEAIGEPSTPSYDSEPASTPGLFTDATAPSELAPTSNETTSGDRSDASPDDFAVNLGDFAANEVAVDAAASDQAAVTLPTAYPVLFPLESESHAIAADPPGTFLLEGMDDLFADTPIAPPVTPISPPILPAAELPASFTLEGMDELFADSLSSDRSVAASMPAAEPPLTVEGVDEPVVSTDSLPSASVPAAEPPFTLEGVDDLFADEPVLSAGLLPYTSTPAADQPLPFTLEGVDELFTNEPVDSTDSLPSASAPAAEPPFTLEGVDELFTNEPVDSTDSLPSASAPAAEPPFTLEGVDALFPNEPVDSTDSLPSASASAAELPFTVEDVDDLFADEPVLSTGLLPYTSTPAADQPLPFTLEGVDELFADMPPVTATPPVLDVSPVLSISDSLSAVSETTTATASTQPEPVSAFTLEQVDNLFVSLPATEAAAPDVASAPMIASAPTPSSGESTALAAPFTLEQVGDLFVEVPSEESTFDERSIATPTAPLEPSFSPSPAPFTLEQVGDLFVETPSTAAPMADLPDVPLSAPPLPMSEPSVLEQAFASLMGSFDESLEALPAVSDPTETTTQAPEKKKEMS